jgi:hypothetical protein
MLNLYFVNRLLPHKRKAVVTPVLPGQALDRLHYESFKRDDYVKMRMPPSRGRKTELYHNVWNLDVG